MWLLLPCGSNGDRETALYWVFPCSKGCGISLWQQLWGWAGVTQPKASAALCCLAARVAKQPRQILGYVWVVHQGEEQEPPDGNDPPNIPFQNTVLILSIPTSVSVLIQGHPGQFFARKQMLSTKCTYLKTFQPKPSSEQSSYSFTVHFYYFFPSFIVGQFSLGTKLKSWLILQGGAVRT